jgi:hypothetical protein
MSDAEEILARLLTEKVRDDVLLFLERVVIEKQGNALERRIYADFKMDEDNFEEHIRPMMVELVDRTIQTVLYAFSQEERIKIAIEDNSGKIVDFMEIAEEAIVKYIAKDGWIDRYSARLRSKYGQRLDAEIRSGADLVRQMHHEREDQLN